jgi:hypothetical protein
MDDAGTMRSRERISNLNPDLQCLTERQRAFLEALLLRLAFQELHH